jgi:cell division protein FtsQ
MAEKRKISVRKILQLLLTLVVTTCCIIAMVSAARIENNETLTSVAVHIRNDKKYHFIEQKEILDKVINDRHIDITHIPLGKLDIHIMEQLILSDPWVSEAQVYIDNERILHISVTQRIPVARIFQQNGLSYYLDTTLSAMPLSDNFKYYTTVVTNVPELKNDSAGMALKKQMVSLVRHILADSFWSAQVSQVIVDSNGTFELMPVIGNQRILFGDATRINEKFGNLFLFYKNVLNRIGWDKYETLDLRFKDQVIALPSLPYQGPVDKAVANMNWINSIVETEAVSDAKDSLRAAETKAAHAAAQKKKEQARQAHKTGKQAKAIKKPSEKAKAKKETKKPDNKKQKAAATKRPPKPPGKKVNEKNKDKTSKQRSPKYVYPEKKDK